MNVRIDEGMLCRPWENEHTKKRGENEINAGMIAVLKVTSRDNN